MYYQYKFFQYDVEGLGEQPRQQFIFVEGKPGTGKNVDGVNKKGGVKSGKKGGVIEEVKPTTKQGG